MLGKLAFTNKIVAKNLGQKEERVTRVMSFFTEELNKELASCEHPFVYIKGLGTFTLSLGPIERKLRRMVGHYKKALSGKTPKGYAGEVGAIKRTLFELFAMRRLLKNKRKEIKILKDAGKASRNSKGEFLPVNR